MRKPAHELAVPFVVDEIGDHHADKRVIVEAERSAEARAWLEAGLELARARGDGKTAGELESELANAR